MRLSKRVFENLIFLKTSVGVVRVSELERFAVNISRFSCFLGDVYLKD